MNESYRTDHRLPFIYSFPLIVLTTGLRGSTTLQFDVDSAFECWAVRTSTSLAAAATDISPNYIQFRLRDGATGQWMSGSEIPNRIYTPQYGENRYPMPVIFAPGTPLACEYTDVAAASHNVTIALIGYKLFG